MQLLCDPFLDRGIAALRDGFPLIVGHRLVAVNHANIVYLCGMPVVRFLVEAEGGTSGYSISLRTRP